MTPWKKPIPGGEEPTGIWGWKCQIPWERELSVVGICAGKGSGGETGARDLGKPLNNEWIRSSQIPEPTESGLVFPPLRIQARLLPAGVRNSSSKSQKNPALELMLSWELLLGLPGGIRGLLWHSRCFIPAVPLLVLGSTGKWVFPWIFIHPVADPAKIPPLPRDDCLKNPRKLQVEWKVWSGKSHPWLHPQIHGILWEAAFWGENFASRWISLFVHLSHHSLFGRNPEGISQGKFQQNLLRGKV